MASENRPTIQINLRLEPEHLKALDEALPAGVTRSAWIRGAILRRLGVPFVKPADPQPRD